MVRPCRSRPRLVVKKTILKNMSSSMGRIIIPYIMENKKCHEYSLGTYNMYNCINCITLCWDVFFHHPFIVLFAHGGM